MKLSPMMQQYMDIKAEYSDCILFFRLGDFYEMFFDDAELVSRLLELTLTGKSCGLEERAPMCGVPFHAADSYISRLVEKGYKVAICEQLEDPATAKGMVDRGVIRVVTPGTVTSNTILHENENNYLAAVYADPVGMAVSYCDISTGELYTTEFYGALCFDDVINELVKISAKEVLVNQKVLDFQDEDQISLLTGSFVRSMSDSYFSEKSAETSIRAQFGGLSLTALGLEGRDRSVSSTGALISYLVETQKSDLKQITRCIFYETGNHMALDKATIRNLELTETLYEKRTDGSLLGVMDKTATAMGGRKLKLWLREPLNDPAGINARLDAVSYLVDDPLALNDVSEALKRVYDFERLAGRMASGNANGKDMIALRNSIGATPDIKDVLTGSGSELLEKLASEIRDLSGIYDLIDTHITEEPPMTITEGGLIREGSSEELDALKDSIKDAKAWIAGLEAKEKERTGITHLKVGYNKVFGYYIEISRSNLDMVPEDYIRKQTLVGAERFITPELKEKEALVLNAETKINKLEYDIFNDIRSTINEHIEEIQETSRAIATVDVLASFAKVASKLGYVRPEVDDGYEIRIEKGRHPVIEQSGAAATDGLFVSNDTYMNNTDTSMLILTGPNMAGKSTYMRQTALIVLMAQCGSFVPADSAKIGVVDRIFTRIGASDNLSRGQSTFFVEMSELAYILRNAGKRSLIILDEIGRGTSTYDGLSIAWATVEKLCTPERKIRTLFATHYHEMTVLADELDGVQNLNVDVAEENGRIIFLHKIVPGSASRSYGIHVARLAGVPKDLLENAELKLEKLEDDETVNSVRDAFGSVGGGGFDDRNGAVGFDGRNSAGGFDDQSSVGGFDGQNSDGGFDGRNSARGFDGRHNTGSSETRQEQISFFTKEMSPAVEKLKSLDIMETTPAEAIRILTELKELADKE